MQKELNSIILLVLFQWKVFFTLKDSIFVLNFKKPNQSKLKLKFDLNSSSAGFDLATNAMLGETVLYAEKYPYIYFESKKTFHWNNSNKIIEFNSLCIKYELITCIIDFH